MASSWREVRFGLLRLPASLLLFSVFLSLQELCFALNGAFVLPSQLKLVQDLLESYDRKAKPTWDNNRPINVTFSMDLYQILELNEPQQYILLNAWIIERWHDEFLYWNPDDYNNISEIRLPHDSIWLPDTTLYNSLVMKDDDTRRLLNAKLTTNVTRRAALIELLYPTIYKFSCLLNLQFFPFDIQVCTMTFSSWTYDNKGIDYLSFSDTIGTSNYLENEGWYILKTTVKRKEVKYSCCPNKYTLLKLTLYLRRKPLFYLVNLIIPTSIITLIAIVGFFTTSSASGMREEKVSLGITTLLSMSILMLMVSDQMPTTSTFIPLIGWFILGMIVVISIGTLASSVVIAIQKRGRLGERLSTRAVQIAKVFSFFSLTDVPLHLRKGTKENMEAPPASEAYRKSGRMSCKLSTANRNMVFADSKISWVSALKKGKTQPQTFNGVSMVSDKSTDMLMSASIISDDLSSHAISAPVTGAKSGMPPTGLPPIPPPPPAAVMALTPCEDDTSQAESDNPDSSRVPVGRAGRASKANMVQQINMFAGNVKQSRHLAQQEYEWLATVVERCCFIIFVFAFLVITCGINVIGFLHWLAVEEAIFERDD